MGRLALTNVLTLLVLVAAQSRYAHAGAVWGNFWSDLETQLPNADDSFHGPSSLPSNFLFFGSGYRNIYVSVVVNACCFRYTCIHLLAQRINIRCSFF